jgi:hypothetical protein
VFGMAGDSAASVIFRWPFCLFPGPVSSRAIKAFIPRSMELGSGVRSTVIEETVTGFLIVAFALQRRYLPPTFRLKRYQWLGHAAYLRPRCFQAPRCVLCCSSILSIPKAYWRESRSVGKETLQALTRSYHDRYALGMEQVVGSAPTIPVWKTGVCLSTLYLHICMCSYCITNI